MSSHDPAAVLELLPLAEQDYNTAMDYFIDAAVLGNISAPYVVEMMKAANEGMGTYHEREDEYLAAVAG